MAIKGKAIPVLVLSGLFAGLVALGLHASFWRSELPALPPTCTTLPPDMGLLGPPLSIAQIELTSLKEMQDAPSHIPRVPFGHLNAEWNVLKDQINAGDKIYKFQTPITGGYVALRNRCIVGEITEWIR